MANCLNCQHKLTESEKYCPNCGQRARLKTLSIWSIIQDFLSNLYNVDSKIWKTMRDIWVPGRLAKAYVQGKRESYYNPLRIFIIILFSFFALLLSQNNDALDKVNDFSEEQKKYLWEENKLMQFDTASSQINLPKDSLDKLRSILFASILQQDSSNLDYEQVADDINSQLADSLNAIEIFEDNKDSNANSINNDMGIIDRFTQKNKTRKVGKRELNENGNSGMSLFGAQVSEMFRLPAEELKEKYGNDSSFREFCLAQAQKIVKDLSSSVKFLLGNGTWALIAIILLQALFYKLLYFRHPYFYAEHVLFHLLGHTRILLLLIIGLLLNQFIGLQVQHWIGIVFLIGVLYLYFGMRAYYKQSFMKTLVKIILAGFNYLFLILICSILILGVSFLVL